MKKVVFYSWQSDLPNSTNRGFIQDALEKAAKAIERDDTIGLEALEVAGRRAQHLLRRHREAGVEVGVDESLRCARHLPRIVGDLVEERLLVDVRQV